MVKLAIYGCGGSGRELLPIARGMLRGKPERDAIVFVSDTVSEIGTTVNGIVVLSFDQLISSTHRNRNVVLSPGSPAARRHLFEKCARENLQFASIAAATHRRCDDVMVGDGAVFSDFSICTVNVRIGRQFQCNIYGYVTHDCVIGDFVTFGPRASCNGHIVIEDDVHIGAGALLRNGTADRPLRIGQGATVGMGAVVTKDVEPFATVVGNPARPITG